MLITIYSLAKFNEHTFYDRKDILQNVSPVPIFFIVS